MVENKIGSSNGNLPKSLFSIEAGLYVKAADARFIYGRHRSRRRCKMIHCGEILCLGSEAHWMKNNLDESTSTGITPPALNFIWDWRHPMDETSYNFHID